MDVSSNYSSFLCLENFLVCCLCGYCGRQRQLCVRHRVTRYIHDSRVEVLAEAGTEYEPRQATGFRILVGTVLSCSTKNGDATFPSTQRAFFSGLLRHRMLVCKAPSTASSSLELEPNIKGVLCSGDHDLLKLEDGTCDHGMLQMQDSTCNLDIPKLAGGTCDHGLTNLESNTFNNGVKNSRRVNGDVSLLKCGGPKCDPGNPLLSCLGVCFWLGACLCDLSVVIDRSHCPSLVVCGMMMSAHGVVCPCDTPFRSKSERLKLYWRQTIHRAGNFAIKNTEFTRTIAAKLSTDVSR